MTCFKNTPPTSRQLSQAGEHIPAFLLLASTDTVASPRHTTNMAAATPAWQDVLDQADDATAALIIKLQMLDVQELAAVEANHSFAVSDLELACRDMEVELRRCRHDRGLPEDLDPVAVAAEAITSQQQMHIQYVDCSSCSGSFPSPDIKQVRCEDWYCPVCLEQLFRLSMMDKTLYPPRCCQQTIPLEDVRTFLPRELVLEFAAKKEELDDHQPLYCRIKSCSAYIGVKKRIGRWACCAESDCNTTTCTEGDHAPHDGACPPDVATQQVLEVAAQQGWRACPQCKMLVELTIGCNHMT